MKKINFLLVIIVFLLLPLLVEAKEGVHICAIPTLRIYLRPSMSSKVISVMQLGKPLMIVGVYERWQKVFVYGGIIGWIEKKSVLTESRFRERFSYLSVGTEAQEQLVKEYTSYYKGQLSKWGLDILKVRVGQVNRNSINIRTQPGEGHPVLIRGKFGQIYEILREKDGWYEVIVGIDKTGWIRNDLLSSKTEIDRLLRNRTRGRSAKVEYVAVLKKGKSSAMIRTGPSVEYRKIGRVMPGDILFVTDLFADWVRVFMKRGGIGWVFSPLLRIDKELTGKDKGREIFKEDFIEMRGYKDKFVQRRQERGEAQKQELLIEKRIVEKEAELKDELERKRKEHQAEIDKGKSLLQKTQKEFEEEQKLLQDKLAQEKTDWEKKQEEWSKRQRDEINRLKEQNEEEITQQKASLEKQRVQMESFAKEIEEKNRKAKEEIAQMQQKLQKEIERFEEAKKEAVELEEEEESMEDEVFFFDEEVTSELEQQMDIVDSIKQSVEVEIAQEREELAKQMAEIEKEQEETAVRLAETERMFDEQRKQLAKSENKAKEQIAKAVVEMGSERAKRNDEFNRRLKHKELEYQNKILEIQKQIEVERGAFLKRQKEVEDSLSKLEVKMEQSLKEEKSRLEEEMKKKIAQERQQFITEKESFKIETLKKQEELEKSVEKDKQEALLQLSKEMLRKSKALEDSLKAAFAEKEAEKKFELEKIESERRKLDSIKASIEEESVRKIAQQERELAKREKEVLDRINRERQQALEAMSEEKKHLDEERELFLKKQKELDEERKRKEEEWREVEEEKQKNQLDSLQRLIGEELREKEEKMSQQKAEMEKFVLEIEGKNKKDREEIKKMRKSLEEEMKKFEEARKESDALKEEEDALEDEDFFYNDEATEELDMRMVLADSIKQALEKEMAKEKENLEKQKVSMKQEQEEMEKSLGNQKKKLETEYKSIEGLRENVEKELSLKKQQMEEERKKRETEFLEKLRQEEIENKKRLEAEQQRIEAQRLEYTRRQKQIEDSLKTIKKKTLGEIEKERQSTKKELERQAKEEASHIETERQNLISRQKQMEDSLKEFSEKANEAIEEEKQKIEQILKEERGKMKEEISARDSALVAEKKKLEDAWALLEEERRKLKAEKEALRSEKVSAAAGADSKDIDQYEKDFGVFLEAVKEQTETSSRSFNEITKVLSGPVSKIMKVYSKLQKKDPNLSGRITVSFIIQTSGDITNLKIVSKSIENKKLEQAALVEFSACKFKKVESDKKPIIMTYPLLFFPRK